MKYLVTGVLSIGFIVLSAQPIEILNAQVEAFNKKDIEALAANVTDDFKFFYVTADELLTETEGKEAFKKSMGNYYKHIVIIHSTIEEYVVQGSFISFREKVAYTTAEGKSGESSSMGVYQIKDGLISRAWYYIE